MTRNECHLRTSIVLLAIFTLFSMCAFVIIAWMTYMPVKVIEFKTPLTIVNQAGQPVSTIKAGEMLYYKLQYRKYKPLATTIIAQLVNKYTLQFPVFHSNLKPTDPEKLKDKNYYDTAIAQLQFPETAFSGEHYLNINFTYQVNPFRTEIVNIKSVPFMVVGGISHKQEMPMKIWRVE